MTLTLLRVPLHPISIICMLVLDFGRKVRPTKSKESLPRRSWSQGTTNAIKIMLVEKTPSTVLVEGVSFSQATLESACADERDTGSLCWIRHIWNLNIETETPDFRKCGEKRNHPSTNQILITKPQVAEA